MFLKDRVRLKTGVQPCIIEINDIQIFSKYKTAFFNCCNIHNSIVLLHALSNKGSPSEQKRQR